MKRTVEVVLSIIGAFVYIIGAVIGGVFTMLDEDSPFMQDFLQQEQTQTLSDAEMANMQTFMNGGAGSIGTMLLVASIVAIIAGIIAMILFKGNNKPKAASILLLVVGGLTTIITLGTGIFAGIFYIIAGIMGLVRKPKQEISMEQY
ncbi:hypothetical protein JCM21714_2580 [Gracilibacillus boraciitolerans JCM 21714]|uniref:DUF4064 domain-containing protein n=1 Tax=Gracilibacillus boraciitolerans JCM 21714 TaxID=1298598 RepID=W4VJD0_9BACI|nr:DUF4064 domain-containing protein [Gracilibacillus boraciitolerans]GAE93495.1 hypothetical protein JCM21714_2580 [Gracilibacillus boraciitolerans JCM 21714]